MILIAGSPKPTLFRAYAIRAPSGDQSIAKPLPAALTSSQVRYVCPVTSTLIVLTTSASIGEPKNVPQIVVYTLPLNASFLPSGLQATLYMSPWAPPLPSYENGVS